MGADAEPARVEGQESFETIKLSELKDGNFIKFSFGRKDNIQEGTVSNVEIPRLLGKAKFEIGGSSFTMSRNETVQRRIDKPNTTN